MGAGTSFRIFRHFQFNRHGRVPLPLPHEVVKGLDDKPLWGTGEYESAGYGKGARVDVGVVVIVVVVCVEGGVEVGS